MPAEDCEGWTDWGWRWQKRSHSPNLLSAPRPVWPLSNKRRQMEKKNWGICREQSLKTVHEHTSTSFFFPVSFSFSISSSPLIPSFLFMPWRWKLNAADVTHYFGQRTCCIEKSVETESESIWTVGFMLRSSEAILPNHERTDGKAEHLWLQRASSLSASPACMCCGVGVFCRKVSIMHKMKGSKIMILCKRKERWFEKFNFILGRGSSSCADVFITQTRFYTL